MRNPANKWLSRGSAARTGTTWSAAAVVVVMAASCASTSSRKPTALPGLPPVSWSALGTVPTPPPHNSYRLLSDGPTHALFPAAVGVTRVASEDWAPRADSDRRVVVVSDSLTLSRDPRNEFLQWNSAFDHLKGVSEVFPLAQRDLGGAAVETPHVLAAMRTLRARVGLIYAVNELSESRCEMFGVLYDTHASQPLAVLHAVADTVIPADGRSAQQADLWRNDSRVRVRTRFAELATEVMRELILRDQSAGVEPTTGWTPAPLFVPTDAPDSAVPED